MDRIFAFGANEGKCSLARVATAKSSQIPYWSAPSPAILLTNFGLFCVLWRFGVVLWWRIEPILDMKIRAKLLQRTLGGGGGRGLL